MRHLLQHCSRARFSPNWPAQPLFYHAFNHARCHPIANTLTSPWLSVPFDVRRPPGPSLVNRCSFRALLEVFLYPTDRVIINFHHCRLPAELGGLHEFLLNNWTVATSCFGDHNLSILLGTLFESQPVCTGFIHPYHASIATQHLRHGLKYHVHTLFSMQSEMDTGLWMKNSFTRVLRLTVPYFPCSLLYVSYTAVYRP